ncbi:MAG: hypothetical protein ACK2UJ_00945 [Candidatus Promineifilaceae bacterium]
MKTVVILLCVFLLLLSVSAVFADDSPWESQGNFSRSGFQLRSNTYPGGDDWNCPLKFMADCGNPPIATGASLNQ